MSSLFFEFNLPNTPTWFYLSLFLAIALFYQFSRPHALRNWDLLALFLFAPGFILIQEAYDPRLSAAEGIDRANRELLLGYVWLLGASLFWFVRCLLDLIVVRRPLLAPNLNTTGMAWFGSALFVFLTAVGVNRTDDPWQPIGRKPAALAGVEEGAAAAVAQGPANGVPAAEVRFWAERGVAFICHFSILATLVLIGWRRFHDLPTGVSAATLYLLLPYTAFHIGQAHHVWPTALILWALYWYTRPTAAGLLLGLSIGTAFFPVLLVPLWLQFFRRTGVGQFGLALAVGVCVSLGVTMTVLALAGEFPDGWQRTVNVADWQPWKQPTTESVWTGVHWAYRLPAFVAYVGFVVTAWVWPPVRNLGNLIALSAAGLIGIQFWFADRGGLYVLWYLPLLILVVLRPNTSDLLPVPPGPGPGFAVRLWTWVGRRVISAPREPEVASGVSG